MYDGVDGGFFKVLLVVVFGGHEKCLNLVFKFEIGYNW